MTSQASIAEREGGILSIPRERSPAGKQATPGDPPADPVDHSPKTIRVSLSPGRSPSRGPLPARATRFPQIIPEQLDQLLPLREEITALTRGSARFSAFRPSLITDSANMLVRYGIHSAEAFRQTDKQARAYLFEDFRQREQKTYPELSFIIAMNQHLPPPQPRRSYAGYIRFVELDIPRTLPAYPPKLSGLAGLFRPSREMVNFISRELATAASKGPSFKPYLSPKLHTSPWMPDSADHVAAQTQWKNYAESSKKVQLPLDLSIQSFPLYQLRFVLAADICSAWAGFGGLGAHLSHLSIALNLAVIETVGVALSYHNILSTRLTERARQRSTAEAEFAAQLSPGQFDVREQARREVANAKPPSEA